jgi:predicted O-methyltransferase YrrM
MNDQHFPTDEEVATGKAVRDYAPTLSDGLINDHHRALAEMSLRDDSVIDHPIFGWLRPGDALKLYEMAYYSGGDILEIGTHKGLSSFVMAEALKDAGSSHRVVTIDIEAEYSLEARKAHAARAIDNVVYKVGNAPVFLDRFISKGRKFGFAFVDHSHKYKPTQKVCERLPALLLPGSFVFFHDFADPRNVDPDVRAYDVIRAVKDHLPASFEFRGISGCSALYRFAGAA